METLRLHCLPLLAPHSSIWGPRYISKGKKKKRKVWLTYLTIIERVESIYRREKANDFKEDYNYPIIN